MKDNELYGQAKVVMTKYHMQYLAFKLYRDKVESHPFKDENVRNILKNLAIIHGLDLLIKDCGSVFEAGYFGEGSFSAMRTAMAKSIGRFRPQMIPTVEAFKAHDGILVSAIGNSYGDIYETQLEWAKNSRLNKRKIPPYFEEYIKPILQAKL